MVLLRDLDTLAGFAVTKAFKLVQFSNPLTWLPPRSLRLRLIALWLAVAAACGVAAFLMWEMFQISVSAQVDRADAILGKGCANIAERYRFYTVGWRGARNLKNETLKRDLAAVVNLALRDLPGVEGGIWQTEAGPLAYAFRALPRNALMGREGFYTDAAIEEHINRLYKAKYAKRRREQNACGSTSEYQQPQR